MTIKTTRAAGIVLDPVQLAEELTTLKQKPRHDGHALLCELPDAVVRLLENPTIPHGIAMGIAKSRQGMLCVAVHIQAASTQVMYIVPMVDQVARDWFIEAVEVHNSVTLAVSVPETRQVALLSSARLVDNINGEQWHAAKQRVMQSRYDLEQEALGLDLHDLLLKLEAAPRAVISSFAVETLHVVVCIPDPEYVSPGRADLSVAQDAMPVMVH